MQSRKQPQYTAEDAGTDAANAHQRNRDLCAALQAVVTAPGIREARAIARKALREHDETVRLERQ